MKKIILDYFLFIAIVSFFLVGCGHKSNNDNNEKGCYGEIIRYDLITNSSVIRREILISGESGKRILFNVTDANINENNKEIKMSKVGDMVSVVYKAEYNIISYKIIKQTRLD